MRPHESQRVAQEDAARTGKRVEGKKERKTFSILYLWQQLPPSCCLTRSKVLHPAATQIDGQLDVK